MRKAIAFLFFVVLVTPLFLSSNLQAQGRQRFGLSLGGGAGILASSYLANDLLESADNGGYYYPVESASFSPMPSKVFFSGEFHLVADIAFLRFGMSIGSSKYSYTAHWHYETLWGDIDEDMDYDLSLIPFSISIAVYPLRFKNPNSPLQLFVGVCSQGVNDKGEYLSYQSGIGPIIGLDVYIGELLVIGIEARYLFDSQPELNAGNIFSSVLSVRFRIPFNRRQF
jgi:hypothetical protein